jgi:alpha-tubulin suppressor-like RCC1 family protein
VPVLVDGGHTFLSISAGGEHTCGVIEDGSLYCWGRNVLGQLGDGSTTDAGTPVRVSEPSG